jgi:hypothetical protein
MSMHRRPVRGRRTGLAAAALAVAALTTLGASAPALAAKGGNGGAPHGGNTSTGSYTVTVDQAGPYQFGEQVTFTTNAPAVQGSYMWLKCYQGSTTVLATDHANFASGWYYGDPFWLGPTQSWGSGDADCTMTVVHTTQNKVVTDATTSFHVTG